MLTFFFVNVSIAQNLSGIWNSTSGNSFKVVQTTNGIKYHNLLIGSWINAAYTGNNQYKAHFYSGRTLTNIITYQVVNRNTIKLTYYNGKTLYWSRKEKSTYSSPKLTTATSSKSKSLRIQQYQLQIKSLKRKIRDTKQQLANYQSYNSNYGAGSIGTEHSYNNLIQGYENQIRQLESYIRKLRGY